MIECRNFPSAAHGDPFWRSVIKSETRAKSPFCSIRGAVWRLETQDELTVASSVTSVVGAAGAQAPPNGSGAEHVGSIHVAEPPQQQCAPRTRRLQPILSPHQAAI